MSEALHMSSAIAVLQEQVRQLEDRCDKKDIKIEALQAFQNRSLGLAMAASALASLVAPTLARVLVLLFGG